MNRPTRTRSAVTTTSDRTGRSGGLAITSGIIAMVNLDAQITGQWGGLLAGQFSTDQTAEWIELIALRGRLLGRVSDYEAAERYAEWLCGAEPRDGTALLARARCRARFHQFPEALDDLDHAEQLGCEPTDVAVERAAVLQALGRFDEATAILNSIRLGRNKFEFFAALATLAAARGEPATAEKLFDQAANCYRGVSPIPLADLEHQRGHMWLRHGSTEQAVTWLRAAHQRVLDHAPVQGHLAEAEARCGRTHAAIGLLQPLAERAEDPTYGATLARLLHAAGRPRDAARWHAHAAQRYARLIAKHPEAFSHHAASMHRDPPLH
jgi:tetratricopeptide (TPR) repeat protein